MKKNMLKYLLNKNKKVKLTLFPHISILLQKINDLERIYKNFSDKQLKDNTVRFKHHIKVGRTLEQILPEAFATVRESCKRVFNMRLFDVQLIGGIVLHYRSVAEMRTGEGKTITSTLPAYLNALTGKGVHIVTVNDYLAQRDSENHRSLFYFLGLSVGVTSPNMYNHLKKIAYQADITYGTNNEYVFDYLRDNMVMHSNNKVQRELHYALIDEVDSILIDEARTPLIISGLSNNGIPDNFYQQIDLLVSKLKIQQNKESIGDFFIDIKNRIIYLNDDGFRKIENDLVQSNILPSEHLLYSTNYIKIIHCINNALKARHLFHRDRDYIVQNEKIVIIDEHTGRIHHNRRWVEGLHIALEAKEKLPIQNDNQDLASITFQNYFRLYTKLSGMSGTAISEAKEFLTIYNLNTIAIPSNKPMVRIDLPDTIYLNENDKISAIIKDIKERIINNQPILVGTRSIEKSEALSKQLTLNKIHHTILNAKFHASEAEIISKAGEPGNVTIATNMAGRGTDIMLGGDMQREIKNLIKPSKDKIKLLYYKWRIKNILVKEAGGLHIIGTERNELRRIDNQLIGRAGRQGDPGSSKFYHSIQDNLLLRFGVGQIGNIFYKLSLYRSEPIQHYWLYKAILRAQLSIERDNFNIRKELLKYDNITNQQRQMIFIYRNKLLSSDDLFKLIRKFTMHIMKEIMHKNYYQPYRMIIKINKIFSFIQYNPYKLLNKHNINEDFIKEIDDNLIMTKNKYLAQELNKWLKIIFIETLDDLWLKNIKMMNGLKNSIHFKIYANKNPIHEYKKEVFKLFSSMITRFKYLVLIKFFVKMKTA